MSYIGQYENKYPMKHTPVGYYDINSCRFFLVVDDGYPDKFSRFKNYMSRALRRVTKPDELKLWIFWERHF